MAQLEKLKLTTTVWDSDKDPQGFQTWLDTLSSLVAATEDGQALEDFITYKTGRETFTIANVPTFLSEDPDFAMDAGVPVAPVASTTNDSLSTDSSIAVDPSSVDPPVVHGVPISPLQRRIQSQASSMAATLADIDSVRTGVNKRMLRRAPHTYLELPDKSKTLDALLYNVLKMIVKGSKNALLACVMFPSYVQAVIVLINHMDISKYDRITRAIFRMDKLTYSGDVHIFQVECMNAIRELRASKANMTHLILTRLLSSPLRENPRLCSTRSRKLSTRVS
jgi:hypothetical protein